MLHILINIITQKNFTLTKKELEKTLTEQTKVIPTIHTLRKLFRLQSQTEMYKKRVALSLYLQYDRKNLVSYHMLKQKKEMKYLEKKIQDNRTQHAKYKQRLNLMETIFKNNDLLLELARSLLGDALFVNVLKNGIYLGEAEITTRDKTKWRKVGVALYSNILFLTKIGTDSFHLITYISRQQNLICFGEMSGRSVVRVDNYLLSFGNEENENKWKDQLTSIFQSPRLSSIKFQKFNRMSVSVMNSSQFSTHIDSEIVVGVSLSELSKREGTVGLAPRVYRLLLQHLTDHCTDVEGILRKAGDQQSVSQLNSLITKRTFSLNDLKSADPHAIVSSLKTLFHKLPVRLIPRSINDSVVKLVDKNLPNHELVMNIRALLINIPPENFDVFRLLCKLFTAIINKSPTNKMTLQNVLTCFVESVHCSPSVFTFALQNQSYFFDYQL
ncbi:Rho-GAP domain-containing protein [Entamoeba marina]